MWSQTTCNYLLRQVGWNKSVPWFHHMIPLLLSLSLVIILGSEFSGRCQSMKASLFSPFQADVQGLKGASQYNGWDAHFLRWPGESSQSSLALSLLSFFFFPRLRGHCDWRTQWQRSLGSTGTTGGASLGGVLLLADLSGGLPMRDQDAGIQVGHVCLCVQCIFSKPCHAVPSLFLGSKLQNYRLGTGSVVAYQPVSQFEIEEHQNWKAVFLKSYEFRSRNFLLNEKSLLKVICRAKPNTSQALSQEFDRSHCSKLFFFEWLGVSLVHFIAPMSWSCWGMKTFAWGNI